MLVLDLSAGAGLQRDEAWLVLARKCARQAARAYCTRCLPGCLDSVPCWTLCDPQADILQGADCGFSLLAHDAPRMDKRFPAAMAFLSPLAWGGAAA